MLLSLLFFVVGIMVGAFVYSQMLLPLIYGIPVASYMVFKGKMRPMGILIQFVTPIIWVVGLIILGLVLALVWPSLGEFFSSNPSFGGGTFFGLLLVLWGLITSKGRAMIRRDFNDTTVARYGR